jgi:queuosine precursor transporter
MATPDTLTHKSKHYYHLVMISVLFAVICIPTAGKTIDVMGVPQSISILFFPLVYIAADLLTEVYGYALARRALWYSVVGQIITMVIFQFVALAPASGTMTNADAFHQVLSQAPYFVIIGLIATFIGDICNNYVLAKMKIRSKGKNMASRFVVSTMAGEFVNTFIFYFFALTLTGIIPFKHALASILLASLIKTCVEALMLPITIRAAKKLKKIEGIDIYDTKTDFNPIKF